MAPSVNSSSHLLEREDLLVLLGEGVHRLGQYPDKGVLGSSSSRTAITGSLPTNSGISRI